VLYLFDANVLITANNSYYPLDAVPEFWEWLAYQASEGFIKIPAEILEEVMAGKKNEDPLLHWVSKQKDVLQLKAAVEPHLVQRAVTEGYASDLTDDELIMIGKDPFLISYALADTTERCVVTVEVSKPGKRRQNRQIPDVCRDLGVICMDPFRVYRALRFSTSWTR